MTEEQRHHTHRQKFAQAIARLAGDADAGKQNRGVEDENRHAAQETLLLGNHRENEVVVGSARRKESERDLLAAPPAFALDAAGADRDQGLFDLVGPFLLQVVRAAALLRSGAGRREVTSKIDEQPLALVIFQFYLPSRRRKQHVHQQQHDENSGAAHQAKEKARRHARDIAHHQANRQQHKRGAEVRFLQNEQEGQDGQADRFNEQHGLAQFINRTAQEMGLDKNERELGKLRRLALKWAEVDPPSRPPAVRGSDARN